MASFKAYYAMLVVLVILATGTSVMARNRVVRLYPRSLDCSNEVSEFCFKLAFEYMKTDPAMGGLPDLWAEQNKIFGSKG